VAFQFANTFFNPFNDGLIAAGLIAIVIVAIVQGMRQKWRSIPEVRTGSHSPGNRSDRDSKAM
jgi:hypothetical protein